MLSACVALLLHVVTESYLPFHRSSGHLLNFLFGDRASRLHFAHCGLCWKNVAARWLVHPKTSYLTLTLDLPRTTVARPIAAHVLVLLLLLSPLFPLFQLQ
jgi:hypothetical protein